jgi:hypothetical protein
MIPELLLIPLLLSVSFRQGDQPASHQESPTGAPAQSTVPSAADIVRNARQQLEELLMHEDDAELVMMRTLRAQIAELTIRFLEKKNEWEMLNEARPEDLPITGDLQAMLANDPRLMRLEERHLQAEEEVAVATAKARGDENIPDVEMAKSVRDFISDQLTAERAQKLVQLQAERIARARHDYLATQEQLLDWMERLFAAEQEARDKDTKRWRLHKLLEESERYRRRYERLLDERQMLAAVPRTLEMLAEMQRIALAGIEVAVTLDLGKADAGPQITFKLPKAAKDSGKPAQ